MSKPQAFTVRYEGKVPKTLRTWCDAHAHQVYEVSASYGFDFERRNGFGYDVMLRAGWSMSDDTVHTLIEANVKDMLAQLRAISPCDCDGCLAEQLTILTAMEFNERLTAVLQRQPEGTALICTGNGRIALLDGSLVGYGAGDDPEETGYDLDGSAWNSGCFDGETIQDTWRYLTRPEFDRSRAAATGALLAER